MNLSNKKGFTLIELLVVIAIIGLLGSVVLASLSNARGKGNDAAIKSNLVNVRTQAELIYTDNYNFNEVCGANSAAQDSIVLSAINEADDLNGDGSVVCGAPASGNASNWAIAADLPGGGAFCVDSRGVGRSTNSSGLDYTASDDGARPALSSAADVECN